MGLRRLSSILILSCVFVISAIGQEKKVQLPKLKECYPRMVDAKQCKKNVKAMLKTKNGAEAMQGIYNRVDKYLAKTLEEPDWLLSRLQMYWHSHATDIYVDGEYLAKVEGHAPAPTVRYPGSRGTISNYNRPKLEDIKPYQDSLGIWMYNKVDKKYEWADPAKTARNVESINCEIMKLAKDASFLYWISKDDKYGKFASDVFDTYMTGLYYRNVPVDLNHGQQETLVGMTSFEVIHEDVVDQLVVIYDFLHEYLLKNKPDKIQIYESAFKKVADNIIAKGVPHNNWDLLQAIFVYKIAVVINDNEAYSDGKGREYYMNSIFNQSTIRQWSVGKLIDYGFDKKVGIWKESPSYAQMVVMHFALLMRGCDDVLKLDLVKDYPVLALAGKNMPQYMYPNGWGVCWGDGYYDRMKADIYPCFIANAQQYGKKDQEREFTAMYKCFDPAGAQANKGESKIRAEVETFTSSSPLKLDEKIEAGKVTDYVTTVFRSDELSWYVGRTGMDPQKSLMLSVCASDGSHMHANGISAEFYGKGFVLGPDMGRGAGYGTIDYNEYYSQFPAHNTVCVDGVSSYPVMKSCHGFKVTGCYPESEQRDSIYDGVVYGQFYFLEPETHSDQLRTMAIINTEPDNGYYVDIFRSKRKDGKDKTHDYFYHSVGQTFDLNVPTEPTEELAFAGAHLYAYSYMWNKESVMTDKMIEGRFEMALKGGAGSVGMNMWMLGDENRRVFKANSPMIDALSRNKEMPYNVKESPTKTFVARQYGEAWKHPFVAIYEPVDSKTPSMIKAVERIDCGGEVGMCVTRTNGRKDYILSADEMKPMKNGKIEACAVTAVVSDGHLFMADGTGVSDATVSIKTNEAATAALKKIDGKWFYTSSKPCAVVISGKAYKLPASRLAEVR